MTNRSRGTRRGTGRRQSAGRADNRRPPRWPGLAARSRRSSSAYPCRGSSNVCGRPRVSFPPARPMHRGEHDVQAQPCGGRDQRGHPGRRNHALVRLVHARHVRPRQDHRRAGPRCRHGEAVRGNAQDPRVGNVAELERHQDRASWVSWAIEFVRRGLWPADVITVHGPHASSADHFWGEAEASDESGTWSYTVAFQTPARHGGDRRGVRLWDAEHPGTHFPVVRGSAMSHAQRRWLRVARRLAGTQWQTSGRI